MKRVDKIELIQSFLALVRHGNYHVASEKLGVAKSTLSRRILSLENQLNSKLFVRDQASCSLTEHGVTFLQAAEKIWRAYTDLNRPVQRQQSVPHGTVYISAPSAIGNGLLLDWLKQFQDIYPEVIVDLTLTLGPVRMLPPECDIRINHELFPSERVIARPLGSMLRMMVASERYLYENGVPKKPSDLEHHSLLGGNDLLGGAKLRLSRGQEYETVPYFPKLRLKDHTAARTAALLGLGIAVHAFKYDTIDLVKKGLLCEVLPEWEPDPSPVSLLLPRSKEPTEIVRTLCDFIEARWQSHPYLINDIS